MSSRVPRKLVGRAMADSMSSSVGDDDNSLDGRSSSMHGDRRQSLDYSNVHHSPTVPKSEEKPRRRSSSTRPGYAAGDLMPHFNGSDPVRLELTRLENEVRGKAGRTWTPSSHASPCFLGRMMGVLDGAIMWRDDAPSS
jgi:hypothetical protein